MPITTRVSGYIFSPDGNVIKAGKLSLRLQQDIVSVDGVKVTPAALSWLLDPLAAPTGLAVAQVGAAGTTHNTYDVSSVDGNGGETLIATVATLLANATLNGTNYNHISWTAAARAAKYRVYGRTSSGTRTLLAETTNTFYDDQGAAAIGTAEPTANTTGGWIQLDLIPTDGASPSGVTYIVEFDPAPDVSGPVKAKSGYWSNFWGVPNIGTVPVGNFVTAHRGQPLENYLPLGGTVVNLASTVLLGGAAGTTGNKRVIAHQLSTQPEIRYNDTSHHWELSHDGVTFEVIATPSVGDITGVIAGTGLTGGGLSGDVTVNIATQAKPAWLTAIDWSIVDKSASSLADLATRSASDLSSGTLPDARFPATLPAVSGASLTSLDAGHVSAGLLAVARGGINIGSYAIGDILYASATGVLSKLGIGAGVLIGGSAPAWSTAPAVASLAVGTSPASTGLIRLANGDGLNWRDSSNSSDVAGIKLSSANSVAIAAGGAKVTVAEAGGTAFVALGNLTASFPAIKRSGTSVEARLADDSAQGIFLADSFNASSFIQVGSGPATTGVGRFSNSDFLYWRNVANNGNRRVIGLDSGDQIIVGDSGASAVQIAPSLLRFAGSTSSFPALKRNSSQLYVRLADDSGWADLLADNLYAITAITTPTISRGANSTLSIQVNSAARWAFDNSTGSGSGGVYSFYPVADATYDIGSLTNRIGTGYFAASIVSPVLRSQPSTPVIVRPGAGSFGLLQSEAAANVLVWDGSEVYAGSDNAITFGAASNRWSLGYFGTALVLGTNPAQGAGVIRTGNGTGWFARDSTNTLDKFVIGYGTSFADKISIGQADISPVIMSGFLPLGGVSSSFPALKRSSTSLWVRLADDSGWADLTSGTGNFVSYVSVGSSAATSGSIRLAYGGNINSLNNAGTSDVGLIQLATIVGEVDTISIGGSGNNVTPGSANAQDSGRPSAPWRSGYFGTSVVTALVDAPTGNSLLLNAPTGAAVAFNVNGVTIASILAAGFFPQADNSKDVGSPSNRFGTGYFGTALVVGSNPASAGSLRMPTGPTGIVFRNNANNADLQAMGSTSSDVLLISGNYVTTQIGSGGTFIGIGGLTSSFPALQRNAAGINFRLADDSGYTNVIAAQFAVPAGAFVNAAGTITAPNAYQGPGTVASSGDWRAKSGFGFAYRNSVNSADLQILASDSSDRALFGDPGNGVMGVLYGSRIGFGGTTSSFPALKANGSQIQFKLADDSGFCSTIGGVVAAATAFTGPGLAATAGDWRAQSNFSFRARNSGNSADISVISYGEVATDENVFGSSDNGTTTRVSSGGLGTPASLRNGDWWVECIGTTPSRVAAIKVRDGGVTRTIASITY